MAVWGVGRLVSAAMTPRMLERLESRHQPLEPYFIALLILTFACFLGVFEVRGMPGMLGFVLLAGIFDAATETIYYSLLQSTPAASHDRVIGISYVAERTGLGLGMLAVGFVFSCLGTDVMALLFYCGSIALAGLAFVGVKRRVVRVRRDPPEADRARQRCNDSWRRRQDDADTRRLLSEGLVVEGGGANF